MTDKHRRGRAIILRDIADSLSVSMMTVSRALRGLEGVSPARRSEIVALAKRLNYVPNSNARPLAVTNADLVGISMPNLFNDVFADILAGMRGTIVAAGYSSVIDTTDFDLTAEAAWVERLLTWRPSGIVLTGVHHAPGLRDMLRATGVPVLEIWDHTDDPIDINVGMDHVAAGRLAAEHALALGYQRPAFVGGPHWRDRRAEGRLMGLRTVYPDPGGTLINVARPTSQNAFEAGFVGAQQLLAQDRPDVIFYLNDHLAFGGMMACQAAGLRVPDDIGTVGFNGLGITRVLSQKITTVVTPRRQMGMLGARDLLARIHGARCDKVKCLSARLVPGETTRPQ